MITMWRQAALAVREGAVEIRGMELAAGRAEGAGETLLEIIPAGGRGSLDGGDVLVRLRVLEKVRSLEGRRVVCRACAEDGREVAVKLYLPNPRQGRDSEREWRNLLRLESLALAVPEPLFRGRTPGGAEALVLAWLDGARSLREEVFSRASSGERTAWMALLLELLASQHAAGVRQTDSHWGNVVVSNGKLYALDAAGFAFDRRPVSRRGRIRNLAAWFVRMNPLWEEELWSVFPAYLNAAGPAVGDAKRFREATGKRMIIERRKLLREQRRKGGRSCSAHRVWNDGKRRIRAVRDLPAGDLEVLLRDPDGLLANAERSYKYRAGGTCTVAEIVLPGGRYVLKRYNKEPALRRWMSWCLPGRGAITWNSAQALRVAHVATARPLVLLEDGGGKGSRRQYVLLERIEGTRLDDWLEKAGPDSAEADRAMELWQGFWRALSRIRAVHGDAKAANYMAGAGGALVVLDLDSFRFPRWDPVFRRGRTVDRMRFLRNWDGNLPLRRRFEEVMDAVERSEAGADPTFFAPAEDVGGRG
ncbi:MAG TPA: hypothetical protein VMN36_15575 [Verrucomicrobiales bacterium]|nr:hypothetical protein [Verrucomicrobiales bacterium]